MAKNKEQKTLVLLDAHAILHRAYHALPEFSSSKGEPTGAIYGLAAMLMKIIKELSPDYIVACYDLPEPTFRHEAYEDYKAGRAKAADDLVHQIKSSRKIFEAFHIPIYEKAGFEADDLLGTIVNQVKDAKDLNVIIASGDMDTLQLVDKKRVTVYTLKKGINDTILYDEKGVEERFGFSPKLLADYKGLRGDPSDNIPGIRGIGEKTATTLISTFGSVENIYKALKKDEEAFKKVGITPRIIGLLKEGEEEALFSKTLGTIRHDAPITFDLPKKTWQESFDIQTAEDTFAQFEFRTLRDRLREAFGQQGEKTEEKEEEITISDKELTELKIAVWLLNSEITNPTLDDVIEITGTRDMKKAREILEKRIKENNLEKVYYDIELPLMPIIAAAEKRGILVDTVYLERLSKEYHKELATFESAIFKEAGREFNINSPKQLGEVLFDELNLSTKGLKKTSGGARSTRESELLKLKDEHEIIAHILSYRELQKLLSTYIDNIPKMIGKDGRLHTNLNQAGTTTGRMSSNNPNMQNIPVRDGHGAAIRSAFVAEKGYVLAAFDYSQIEIRVLAALSQDPILIDTFQKGKDVHAAVASYIFGVPEEEVTKEMRRRAKVVNFGIIYGMGVNALKEALGTDRKEAQQFYDDYFKKFPSIAGYLDNVKHGAQKTGYTETLFGRRRYFDSIRSSIPYIRASAERMAINAPLQGTAADIMKIATHKADDAIKKHKLDKDVHLLLSVHDELIFEIKHDALKKAQKIIKEAMECIPGISIPLVVDISAGERWGEMKHI